MERDHLPACSPGRGAPRDAVVPPGSEHCERGETRRQQPLRDPWQRQAQRRRQATALAGLLASAALVSAGCSGNHRPVSPAGSAVPVARGTASWYGTKFNGRPTANGERYDMHSLTAAHPNLPFGTLVQVTNLENGRQVVVRINDRGPFGRRRVIDLSYAAARQLAMVGPGTARVELAVVGRFDPAAQPAEPAQPIVLAANTPAAPVAEPAPEAATSQCYTVQVGAFGEVERADALRQDLVRDYPAAAVHSDGTWHRVQVGVFGDREQAEALRSELAGLGLSAIVVAAP